MQLNDIVTPPQTNISLVKSRCLYVRGINRGTTPDLIRCHFSICGEVERIEFSENPRLGYGWVHFISQESADRAERDLHHSSLNGCIITVRFEFGKTNETDLIVKESQKKTACVPRFIKENISGKRKNKAASNVNVSYKGQCILVDNVEYPIPQGKYLMKVLKLCHSSLIGNRQPLIDTLLDSRHGNKHPKEISESMAVGTMTYSCYVIPSLFINIEIS
jgi:RNA recognition motif-containing protein